MFFPCSTLPNDSPPIISYVGRLSRQKGLDTLVKAINQLQERLSLFKVYIVGDGELKPMLQNMVCEYGLEDKTTFTGAIPNVVDYYQRSRIIVMPSYYEGLPLVLLEAMACGVPVVASPVGGILDVLGPPVNPETAATGYAIAERGIFVEPGNVHALAAALYRLSTDKQLRERLSHNALAHIKEFYTLDQVIKKYIELFTAQPGVPAEHSAARTA
jgi:glycosyltransferase involved in cell wall biosynthesis